MLSTRQNPIRHRYNCQHLRGQEHQSSRNTTTPSHRHHTLLASLVHCVATSRNTEDIADILTGGSAFGKVVDGFDTLERVDAARKENGRRVRDRIGIKSTKIIAL